MENKEINEKILEIWRNTSENIRGENWPVLYPNFTMQTILFIGLNPGERKAPKIDNFDDLENKEKIEKIINFEKTSWKDDKKYFGTFQEICRGICGHEEFNHLDLYFYRKGNSNKFMEENVLAEPDFFKEQLKISLDTIPKIKPRIIFVANSKSSKIIKEELNDKISDLKFEEEGFHRININGKLVPIFFSGMISSQRKIDDHSLKRLIWHLKKALEINST